jgi:hypothetical protein
MKTTDREPMTDRERKALKTFEWLIRDGKPEQKERVLIAADIMNLLGICPLDSQTGKGVTA